mmetsp:Transcript_1221/g.1776  ORF Transcript_1221/g.1776 Transcript_1221/m.1776 type:complete len:107 (-) Transcript_1221:805-1125(-)
MFLSGVKQNAGQIFFFFFSLCSSSLSLYIDASHTYKHTHTFLKYVCRPLFGSERENCVCVCVCVRMYVCVCVDVFTLTKITMIQDCVSTPLALRAQERWNFLNCCL